MIGKTGPSFTMYSTVHLTVMIIILLMALFVFLARKNQKVIGNDHKLFERLFAISLFGMELVYHIWASATDQWHISYSLPVELCSISLGLSILLLLTGNRYLYNFVFYIGIGGALQAIATPTLELGFPHVRFFHFFYTHAGIILTALYFTWIKEYRPTFKGIIHSMIFLNIIAVFVFFINLSTKGNYMFLRTKPAVGSLLDYLGPYPWYFLSLEAVAFLMSVGLWLLFRPKGK